MSLQAVSALLMLSEPTEGAGATLVTINATGELGGVIGQIRIQGNASGKVISQAGGGKIVWISGSTTFATAGSTVRVGIQDVSTITGLNDGTYDVYADYVQGTDTIPANNYNSKAMTSGSKTLSDGDIIAILVEFQTRNGADSIALSGNGPNQIAAAANLGLPYGVTNTGALAKSNSVMLWAIIVFDDGTLGWILGNSLLRNGATGIAFNSGSSPDEYIGTFTPTWKMQVCGLVACLAGIASTDNFDVILYSDPYGTPTVLQTISWTPTIVAGTAANSGFHIFSIPSTILSPGVTYGIAIKPTTTNSINYQYIDFSSFSTVAGYLKQILYMPSMKVAGRTDGTGAFSEVNADYIPIMGFAINALDDGASSSGGGGAYGFA